VALLRTNYRALLRKMTCNIRHPMGLCHSVYSFYIYVYVYTCVATVLSTTHVWHDSYMSATYVYVTRQSSLASCIHESCDTGEHFTSLHECHSCIHEKAIKFSVMSCIHEPCDTRANTWLHESCDTHVNTWLHESCDTRVNTWLHEYDSYIHECDSCIHD